LPENVREVAWVTISRFLGPARAQLLEDLLRDADIESRLDPEGSTEEDLFRVRVPLDEAEAAFEAIGRKVDEDYRWPPPRQPSGAGKLIRKALGRALRSRTRYQEDNTDLKSALESTRRDPSSAEARLALARALIDADDEDLAGIDQTKRFLWARLALDEAVFLGLGPEACFEMAELCLDEMEIEEASAWVAEATSLGTDPARAAYLECELAFHQGDPKALKSAVSQYRRQLENPDYNLVYAAALLCAAGEKSAAIRIADGALRDGEFGSDEEWASAAALKISMEGGDPQSVADLADLLAGEDEAADYVREANSELARLRSLWKQALKGAKRRNKSVKREPTGGRKA
jgi:hypothetical protein